MGWLNKVKDVLKTAKDVSALLTVFKVPGAKTVSEAVNTIFDDAGRSNDDAVALAAAAIDQLERRVKSLESAVEKLTKAKK